MVQKDTSTTNPSSVFFDDTGLYVFEHLLPNAGFENGSGTTADSWSVTNASYVQRSSIDKQTGSYSMCITNPSNGGSPWSFAYQDILKSIPAGSTITATGYAYEKGSAQNGVCVKVELYNGNTLVAYASNSLAPNSSWAKNQVSVSNNGQQVTRIRFATMVQKDTSTTNPSSVYFDDTGLYVSEY
jgi:hypothetical protein